ncbi:MAG: hypothetical protein A3F70_04225 [Acidobacteria bacterium RIFCSPLOWO2_12_FULL_67_14]|nr:MAG: hypothetical protein A3F70_04225 [Acidobacteria bacterium RIFCSPLOWO2_12_FULL_67_14]
MIGVLQPVHQVVEIRSGTGGFRVRLVGLVLRVHRRDEQLLVRFSHLAHQPLDVREGLRRGLSSVVTRGLSRTPRV